MPEREGAFTRLEPDGENVFCTWIVAPDTANPAVSTVLGQFFLPTAYRTTLQGVIDSPIPFFWNVRKS